MGAMAYSRIQEVDFTPNECAIEIGAERGEGSTKFLRDYCAEHGIPFYSVDVDPDCGDEFTVHMTGEEFLEHELQAPYRIKFAYLDNFDWIHKGNEQVDWIQRQIKRYKELELNMNNRNSQKAHLMQAKLINRSWVAAPGCHILIDDTYPGWDGKGGTAVPWLLEHGYKILSNPDNEVKDWYVFLCKT